MSNVLQPSTLLDISYRHFDALWVGMEEIKGRVARAMVDAASSGKVDEDSAVEAGRKCVGEIEILKLWTHKVADAFSEATEYVPRSWLTDTLETVATLRQALEHYGTATNPQEQRELTRSLGVGEKTLRDPKWGEKG